MKILDITPDRGARRAIISGKQKEIYRSIYHCCDRFLNVDREGYGYFQPACRGDFEDLSQNCNDSLNEFTKLLKQAITDGFFEIAEYDAVRIPIRIRNHVHPYKYANFVCEGITIGKGNPAWGAPEDEEVFIIKLGKRL